jgi:protocatechuate 3,4-dioxygenase, beta subunit
MSESDVQEEEMAAGNRRRILAAAAIITGLIADLAAAAGLQPTPMQTPGPFYPVTKPADRDADLTRMTGKKGHAEGKIIYLRGRVLNAKGEPVKGARVEIWQANSNGRYGHPSETNTARLDPNFQGYATGTTDAQGRFRFKTVKPGAYSAADIERTPHIHFMVTGKHDFLVTQMYFPGEALNDVDPIRKEAGAGTERLTAGILPPEPGMEPDAMIAQWDIVLTKG